MARKTKSELSYKIGKWYEVSRDFVASADEPEWGLIYTPEQAKNKKGTYGWKPRGKLFHIKGGALVMIAKYVFNNEVFVFGLDDKFLYTVVAELLRINALKEINNVQDQFKNNQLQR